MSDLPSGAAFGTLVHSVLESVDPTELAVACVKSDGTTDLKLVGIDGTVRSHAQLADLAASLAFGLARNRPFLDGNQRTAHVCYRVFLTLNGVDLDANDEDKYVMMIALAEGSLSETECAAWLRQHIRLDSSSRVNARCASYKR